MNTRVIFALIIIIKGISLLQVRYSVKDATSQGKTISEKYSHLAIDGDINSCAISESTKLELAWWSVKLDKDYNVEKIIINYNSGSEDLHKYMTHFIVYVSKDIRNLDENMCASHSGKKNEVPRIVVLNCVKHVYGNLVTIKRFGGLFRTWLVLCEVQIHADLEIVSFNKPTFHNGIIFKNTSGLAVDGNNDTCAKIVAHKEEFAWWKISLNEDYYIDKIKIYFNPKSSDVSTINNFNVYVSNVENDFEKDVCEGFNATTEMSKSSGVIELKCREPKPRGKYVTIKKISRNIPHHLQGLCEIEIYSKEYNPTLECNSTYRECLPLQMCLPEHKLCDGVKNCPDGLDESMSRCKCQSHQYMCEWNYQCIPKDWLCDGFKDCPYGDDEKTGCECPEAGMFKCATRQKCIKSEDHCNGVYDCPDLSDEKKCFYVGYGHKLLFIYKGRNDYRLCTTNWGEMHSIAVCNFISTESNPVEYFGYSTEGFHPTLYKYLRLKYGGPFIGYHWPAISDFAETKTCESGQSYGVNCYPSSEPDKGLCGRSEYPDLSPYIINGHIAKAGAWPWHVQLFKNGVYICGGSLIDKNWIATSKVCTRDIKDRKELTVKIGAVLFNDPNIPKLTITVIADVLLDVSLLRLEKPVKFTRDVKPICMPSGDLERFSAKYSGLCIIIGFGSVDREHSTPTSLMQGRMNLMTFKECEDYIRTLTNAERARHIYTKAYNRICAGSVPPAHGINACRGDDGSPLMCKVRKGEWDMVGVMVSESVDCTYSVFANMLRYGAYIYNAMQEEDDRWNMNVGSVKSTIEIFPFIIAMFLFNA